MPTWVCLLLPLLLAQIDLVQACTPDRIDEQAQVQYIFDGDTVEIGRSRKIRFIGINTPELGRNKRPHQPYALEARKALQNLLKTNSDQIQLRFDQEPRDKYNRELAHIYLADGTNVSQWLLAHGLATSLAIPPNTWNADCYRQAELQARKAKRGLWSHPSYQIIDSTNLKSGSKGYRLVRGKVRRIGEGKKSIWLNLEGKLALKISHKDLPYFDQLQLRKLLGKTVIAQGWIYPSKGESRMHIRHPTALQVE